MATNKQHKYLEQNRSGSVLAQTVIAERDNVLFDKNISTPKLSTTNTQANITLTGGLLAQVKQNAINSLPSLLPNMPAYGIFIDGTAGFSLHQNTINGNNANAFGLVVKNTGSYAAEVTENQFMGGINVANLYMNKNSNLTIDCNTYQSNLDWVVLPSNLFTAEGFLEPQGECNIDNSQLARRNLFHTSQASYPNNLHILNLNANEVYYRSYPGFRPNLVTGNADIDECDNDGDDPSQCSAFFGLDYCNPNDILAALIANSTIDDKDRLAEYTKLLYARLCQDQQEQAKTDLNTEARDASYKVLTATYTDENDTLRALEALSKLPLDNADNADFYNLFMQLLGATGSGKNSANYIDMPAAAKQNDRSVQALAQSIVATNNLSVFDKVIPALPIGNNAATTTPNYFKLYPNPATNTVQVQLFQQIDNGLLQLYDITGRLLKTVSINAQNITLALDNCANGIYYIKLTSSTSVLGTQKLIVVK